jgi:hypothetical protein
MVVGLWSASGLGSIDLVTYLPKLIMFHVRFPKVTIIGSIQTAESHLPVPLKLVVEPCGFLPFNPIALVFVGANGFISPGSGVADRHARHDVLHPWMGLVNRNVYRRHCQ